MSGNNEDLLRILISTDNHLGVWEKDEDRKHDSFRAFEEILQVAVEKDVDMLLLGGDLFHDNKPSRSTVIRAVELLNKYCLGDRPIQFRVISDQKQNFVSGLVNFANPNLNIGLPVFTIHGNHDDPAGQDNLSAVDLLSSCGLVNYFGKVLLSGNNIGNITLSPVLLEKGQTKLALYGLGNVRDERLGRLFQTPGCVQWMRPKDSPEIAMEEWLNVFVLHQNRVQHGASAKNCLQERHLPAFMDLVIWGHEHECIPEPQALQAPDNTGESEKAYVIQPGSSVATALSEGESKRKHVILLEMMQNQWRTIKLPLHTVRPFVWDTIQLSAAHPALDPDDSAAITAHLERKVQAMIQQAMRDSPVAAAATQQQQQASGATPAAPPPPPQQQQQAQQPQPLLPLIRLRVDYSGFSTINSQRFGQKFVGKVANPHDMLLWAKAAQRRAKQEGREMTEEQAAAMGGGGLRPEQLDQARIEDLVSANLTAQLDILPPDELALALHNFVEKDEKAALAECVTTVLAETQQQAMTAPGADMAEAAAAADREVAGAARRPIKDEDIANVVSMCVQQRQESRMQQSTGDRATGITAAGAVVGAAGGGTPAGPANVALGVSNRPRSASGVDGSAAADWDDMDVDAAADDNRQPAPAAAGGGGGSRAAGGGMPPPAPKGRGRKGAAAAAAATSSGAGMRQAGLAEVFSRASQQQQGLRSPQGRTGSNLDGYLGLVDAAGASTPSQNTSRSRGTAAGSAARAGRGSRGSSRGRGGGRGRGKKGAAAAELESEEEELVSEEGISSSDAEDEPPAKRARGARPKRAAASKQTSYTNGAADDEDEAIIDSDDEQQQQQQQRVTPAGSSGGRRRTAAGSVSRRHAATTQQYSLISDDDVDEDEPISEVHSMEGEQIEDADGDLESPGTSRQTGRAASSSKGAGRGAPAAAAAAAAGRLTQGAGGRQRGTGGRQRSSMATDPTQATAATAGTALPPQSIDGGFIDSDDEAPAATPAPAAGRAAAAAAGGRRRVLPASLGR